MEFQDISFKLFQVGDGKGGVGMGEEVPPTQTFQAIPIGGSGRNSFGGCALSLVLF